MSPPCGIGTHNIVPGPDADRLTLRIFKVPGFILYSKLPPPCNPKILLPNKSKFNNVVDAINCVLTRLYCCDLTLYVCIDAGFTIGQNPKSGFFIGSLSKNPLKSNLCKLVNAERSIDVPSVKHASTNNFTKPVGRLLTLSCADNVPEVNGHPDIVKTVRLGVLDAKLGIALKVFPLKSNCVNPFNVALGNELIPIL